MVEVALFPIPNVVAFPGVELPLHVFEPRYRRLVHDSVADNRMIGVCDVTGTIRQAPQAQTPEDALRSNQATYKPQAVFSAGLAEILEELPDGRILARVAMQQRLQLEDEIQSLPYRIVTCSPLDDHPEEVPQETNNEFRDRILTRLIAIVRQDNDELADLLRSSSWSTMDPAAFSFAVFNFLQLDPHIMQRVLESRTAHDRLSLIEATLNGHPLP